MKLCCRATRVYAIGGIVIAVEFPDGPPVDGSPAYAPFVSDSEPEVRLSINHSLPPEISAGNEVYRPRGGVIRYLQSGGRHIFFCFASSGDTEPRITAVMDDGLQRGDVYCDEQTAPLDYPFDEILAASLLSMGRGVIIHGCGAVAGGEGLLFVGSSGKGKSTVARLLKDEGAVILNDDRIIVRKDGGEYYIYGTPWHGDVNDCSAGRAPLKAIYFLKHSDRNLASRTSLIDSVMRLVICSFPTFWDKKGMEFTLGFLNALAEAIPSYEFNFLPDGSAIKYIKNFA